MGIATDLLNAKVNTAYISQANMAADFGKTEDILIQMNLKPGVTTASVDKQVKAVAADYPQFTIYAGKAYIDQMLSLVKVVFAGMYFMLAFLALPSLIAMLNTLAINVIERTREIGMLRAVGATRKQVGRMITDRSTAAGGGRDGIRPVGRVIPGLRDRARAVGDVPDGVCLSRWRAALLPSQ